MYTVCILYISIYIQYVYNNNLSVYNIYKHIYYNIETDICVYIINHWKKDYEIIGKKSLRRSQN